MKKITLLIPVVIMVSGMSCYEKKLTQSVWYSHGAWNDDRANFIFLRWEQDFHMPKGLAKFPDGGIPKYVRDELFICVFDRETGNVSVIAPGRGKPRGYPPSARFSYKGNMAAYKIWNADRKENAQNPVVLIDMKTFGTREFFAMGEMPELSPDGKRVACIKDGAVWISNIDGSGSFKAADTGALEPVFLLWNGLATIDVHVSDKGIFAVYALNLRDGSLKKTGRPYLKHYGNESTQEVLKGVK